MAEAYSDLPTPYVVALFGPTGVGKTGVGVEVAGLLEASGGRASIVNCDSIQVYSGLETISGAPSPSEREKVEHRLVGHVPMNETYSSGVFAREAHEEIDSLLREGMWPLLVGGTGLYLRAALSDLDLRPGIPGQMRDELERAWDEEGGEAMHRRLPDRYRETVHPNDRKRVIRYLGLIDLGIEPHSDSKGGGRLWSEGLRHPTLLAGLTLDRDHLEEAIRSRVDGMEAAGAIEEARRAFELGISETASKAIGLSDFMAGDLDSVRQSHLAFARRQMTWMRRMEGVTPIDRTGLSDSEVAARVLDLIRSGPNLNASRTRPG